MIMRRVPNLAQHLTYSKLYTKIDDDRDDDALFAPGCAT